MIDYVKHKEENLDYLKERKKIFEEARKTAMDNLKALQEEMNNIIHNLQRSDEMLEEINNEIKYIKNEL